MTIELYGYKPSSPYRIAVMTAEMCGVNYEEKVVDLSKQDNMKPEFLKLNPQHSIPVMKDGDYVLKESRAIATYLAEKYDQSKKLYPACPKIRGKIQECMYFDMGNLYKSFADITYPFIFGNGEVSEEKYKRSSEVMKWAQDMIRPTGFAAGTDHLTLADICFVATLSTIKSTCDCMVKDFPELNAYLEKCSGLIKNYQNVNGQGAEIFGEYYKSKTSK